MARIIFLSLSLVMLVLAVGGCGNTQIIEPETSLDNKFKMDLMGTGDELQKKGIITFHRRFTRPDEVIIDVWGINAKTEAPAKGTVVILHGTKESKANYLDMGKKLAKRGFDVVLIDLRRHGRSTGKYITCGAKEKFDVKEVVDTLINEKKITAKPLYVFGIKFGGATAIQYAAIEPRVCGVVAIAPWKNTRAKAKRDLGILTSPQDLDKALDEIGKIAEFDPDTTSAVADAKKITCPVYLVHGAGDLVVPVSDSEAIFLALNGPRKLRIILPGIEQTAILMRGVSAWEADLVENLADGKVEMTTKQQDAEKAKAKKSPAAKPAPAPKATPLSTTDDKPKPKKIPAANP
ncbi:MAG: alpha/beta fold hydrolase [Phycisphaerae bacterium]|nr:alpha/beta fold hydrolase [Phycisphaerae bacterium]